MWNGFVKKHRRVSQQWNEGWYSHSWVLPSGSSSEKAERRENGEEHSKFLVASLKACAKNKDLSEGCKLHAHICASGLLAQNAYLGNTLVSMYAKCGVYRHAEQVLLQLPARDVVSWNALIAGLTQNLQAEEALGCYQHMQSDGVAPNDTTYACILKACGITRNVDRGKQIHDEIESCQILKNNVILGTALVDMYAKCGVLLTAQHTLDELSVRNVASWSAMIAGYAKQGQCEEALRCYDRMRSENLSPDAITYACIVKACGIGGAFLKGKRIHDEIVAQGLLQNNIVLGNALIDMYVKNGVLSKAHQVLDDLPIRNVVSWNTLMTGYTHRGHADEALHCYARMQSEGLCPDAITYACVLKACGMIGAVDLGIQIHEKIVTDGPLGDKVMLGTALIDMYTNCCLLSKASLVFHELHVRDVVSYNALMAGYVQLGQGNKALRLYEQMEIEGLSPDAITHACVLKACGIMQNILMGKRIHDKILSQGPLGENRILGNALVDMYAKCGMLFKAQQLLDDLPARDVVSWNALIGGYAQNGQGEEALHCYDRMCGEGLSRDAITYACILKACGITREIARGEKFHHEIITQGLLRNNDVLGNALVDMYAKCGNLMKAQQVHQELSVRSVVSWSALIGGYAQCGQDKVALNCLHQMRSEGITPNVVCWNALIGGYAKQGQAKAAFDCLQWMQQEGMSPDAITFLIVLSACSHLGLVKKGQTYFEKMRKDYGITPNVEHCSCLINLFCRAGYIDEASMMIKKIRLSKYLPIWAALLGACEKWGHLKLGRLAFDHVVCLNARTTTY